MSEFNFNDLLSSTKERMQGAVSVLSHSLAGLRTSRASVSLLDPVKVSIYGSMMPISQVATVSTPEPRMLVVQVWDKSSVKAVEKAILESGLGLNPMTEGNIIRLPMPDMTEQRRKELVKKSKEYLENAKVAIRNIRQDVNKKIKDAKSSSLISEDEVHQYNEKIQKQTDQFIDNATKISDEKAEEIMKV